MSDTEHRREYMRKYRKEYYKKNRWRFIESAKRSRDKKMAEDPDKERARQRVWAKQWRDKNPATARAAVDRYKESHKNQVKEAGEVYSELNQDKIEAKRLVRNAIRRGEMQRKPCVICGAAYACAHHHDYTMPLSVVWLCYMHHAQIHQCLRVWEQ